MTTATRRLIGLTALLALAYPTPGNARQGSYDEEPYGEETADMEGAVYGRLRYLEGPTALRRGAELREDLAPNDPIVPGDVLTTGADSRGEVQLADGSLVTLDVNTEMVVLSLADSAGQIEPATVLQLGSGALLIEAVRMDVPDKRFQIDTQSASIFLLSDGSFRINVRPDGTTSVYSRRGVAEVTARDVSSMVRSGERLFVRPGHIPGEARPFNTRLSDEFDEWAAQRDDALLRRVPVDEDLPPDLPEPVAPYAPELSYYGHWYSNPTYGYVWRPVGLTAGWQPYLFGRWASSPAGLVWVSYEPWGWAPFHYGRWEFLLGTGWVWIPGSVFSGAYVAWGITPGYFGWCPLGYYDVPVYFHFGVASRRAPWVYVAERHLYDRLVHRTVVRDVTVIREIEKRRVVVRKVPASVRPGRPNAAPRASEEVYRMVSNRPELQMRSHPAGPKAPFREQERVRQVKLNDPRRRREAGSTEVPRGRTVSVRTSLSVVPTDRPVPRRAEPPARPAGTPIAQEPKARPVPTNWRPPARRPDDGPEKTIQGILPRQRPAAKAPDPGRPVVSRRPQPQPSPGQGSPRGSPGGQQPRAGSQNRGSQSGAPRQGPPPRGPQAQSASKSGSSQPSAPRQAPPRPAPSKAKDSKSKSSGKGGGKG